MSSFVFSRNHRNIVFSFLLFFFAFSWGCLPQCANKKGAQGKKAKLSAKTGQKQVSRSDIVEKLVKQSSFRKGWFEQTWMVQIVKQPKAIPVFFGKDAERRRDLDALWNNRLQEVAKNKLGSIEDTGHLAIRMRIHLRLASFYKKAYVLASSLNLGRLQKRYERAKKITIGKLFYYYYGRQLCMSGFRKKAVLMLEKALSLVPAERKRRVEAWLSVCRGDAPSKEAEKEVAKLTFSKDKDGVAELVLLKSFFHLDKLTYKGSGERFSFWTRLVTDNVFSEQTNWLKGVVDSETIQAKAKALKISAILRYFDPGVLWGLARKHALIANHYVQKLPATGKYVPFFRGKIALLLREKAKAQKEFATFLAAPPNVLRWEYMLFSHHFAISDLVDEARYSLAMLKAKNDKEGALAELRKMVKEPFPTRSLAALGLIQLLPKKATKERKEAFLQLLVGAKQAKLLSKKLFVFLTKASQAKAPKKATEKQKQQVRQRAMAANACLKWELHRFVVRPLLLWASLGALKIGEVTFAEEWMEQLHRKERAYEIGGFNRASQFILTAYTYIRTGKMSLATLYLAKSKDTYPALSQIWSLLRILRIYKSGASGSSVIVPPVGG